ncbi:MAG: hypothetical protein LBJ14_09790 [Desulfarculales bacterium]|nr:hypothetical protein [Desulfarculales bacterium]
MRVIVIAAVWLMSLSLGGCQNLPQSFSTLDPRLHPDQAAYEESIAPYLLRLEVYEGPATAILAHILPLTKAVRQAQALRQAAAHDMDAEHLAALVSEGQAEAEAYLDIMLSIFTPAAADRKISGPNPTWRIFLLLDGGGQLEPLRVEEITARQRNALLQTFYPYWGYWDSLYRLRFPLPLEGREAAVVVSGPQGRAQSPLKLD